MSEGHSPLSQFEVTTIIPMPPLLGYNIDFTNSSLFMCLAVLGIFAFMFFGMRRRALVPGRLQCAAEMTYEMVAGIVKDTVGQEGKQYFPLIFSLFMFVLFCNLLGMVPYSFTVTSHIIVTFALALFVFLTVTMIGFMRHGLHFLHLFVPAGVPLWLAPLLIPIEIISYLARPITLSIRLAANMTAGHILLKVVAGFVSALGLFGVVPLLLLVGLIGFEFFIALLQAYIFTILTCVYLHDAVHMH